MPMHPSVHFRASPRPDRVMEPDKVESSPPNNSYIPYPREKLFFPTFLLLLKKKKPFLFLPFLLSPFFPLFLCFLKKRFLLFSPPPFFFREWQPFSRLFLIRDHSLGKLYYYFGGRKACCSPRLSRGREIIFHPRFNPFF